MADINVRVVAVPTTPEALDFTIECELCGPLAIVALAACDTFCLDHLEDVHDLDVTRYR